MHLSAFWSWNTVFLCSKQNIYTAVHPENYIAEGVSKNSYCFPSKSINAITKSTSPKSAGWGWGWGVVLTNLHEAMAEVHWGLLNKVTGGNSTTEKHLTAFATQVEQGGSSLQGGWGKQYGKGNSLDVNISEETTLSKAGWKENLSCRSSSQSAAWSKNGWLDL